VSDLENFRFNNLKNLTRKEGGERERESNICGEISIYAPSFTICFTK
jgi:hypothetical protein